MQGTQGYGKYHSYKHNPTTPTVTIPTQEQELGKVIISSKRRYTNVWKFVKGHKGVFGTIHNNMHIVGPDVDDSNNNGTNVGKQQKQIWITHSER